MGLSTFKLNKFRVKNRYNLGTETKLEQNRIEKNKHVLCEDSFTFFIMTCNKQFYKPKCKPITNSYEQTEIQNQLMRNIEEENLWAYLYTMLTLVAFFMILGKVCSRKCNNTQEVFFLNSIFFKV